jgi:hypothetical protein
MIILLKKHDSSRKWIEMPHLRQSTLRNVPRRSLSLLLVYQVFENFSIIIVPITTFRGMLGNVFR